MQSTEDFEERFRLGDTPWEEPVAAPAVKELVSEYIRAGEHLVEIGCGLGSNAIWLAGQGFTVTACDISPTAIDRARNRAQNSGVTVTWLVADIFQGIPRLVRPVDAVITRGVLHTFTTHDSRSAFVDAVATILEPGCLWLDVSGSADTADLPGAREQLGLPRLSLAAIAAAAEGTFEFLSVRRTPYGITSATNFLAFAAAMQRRPTSG